jgi:NAD(P)-dependent dehydrogenase (short-subunit alcohol dehydrogenase family)
LSEKPTTIPAVKKATGEFIPNRFAEQVALVVGGAHGIGKAISVRLSLEGASVVIADMDREALLATSSEIARQGGKAGVALRRSGADAEQQRH